MDVEKVFQRSRGLFILLRKMKENVQGYTKTGLQKEAQHYHEKIGGHEVAALVNFIN